jgi:hypothetical protein
MVAIGPAERLTSRRGRVSRTGATRKSCRCRHNDHGRLGPCADRFGFTHLAFPNPDSSVRVDIIGGCTRLENATLGVLDHVMTHLDHSMLSDEKAVELGRFAAIAAKPALAECKPDEGQVSRRDDRGLFGR